LEQLGTPQKLSPDRLGRADFLPFGLFMWVSGADRKLRLGRVLAATP
jgi:hypothetical protein